LPRRCQIYHTFGETPPFICLKYSSHLRIYDTATASIPQKKKKKEKKKEEKKERKR
jgi:hypothetical protein